MTESQQQDNCNRNRALEPWDPFKDAVDKLLYRVRHSRCDRVLAEELENDSA